MLRIHKVLLRSHSKNAFKDNESGRNRMPSGSSSEGGGAIEAGKLPMICGGRTGITMKGI
jgi:hypothetical protein